MSNVHKKLMAARKAFHEQALSKTGVNTFAKYSYFQLADFIVPAIKIFDAMGLCGVVSFGKEEATLTITDIEDNSSIVITSPMSTAALKGCHEVQNLGAVQTYLRRYLWVAALEIVEHDALDFGPVSKARSQPVQEAQTPREKELVELAETLVSHHEAGRDLEAIKMWQAAGSWSADNPTRQEEQIFVWGQLKPWSKLRSTIKANKTEPA